MVRRSPFHLDCTGILPECGCTCGKCLKEMKCILGGTWGVSRLYREGDGIVVEHDASMVTEDQLMDIFRDLPSFYHSHFIPSATNHS
jgi:hypothetical protein